MSDFIAGWFVGTIGSLAGAAFGLWMMQ